jgi:hypothetical protein
MEGTTPSLRCSPVTRVRVEDFVSGWVAITSFSMGQPHAGGRQAPHRCRRSCPLGTVKLTVAVGGAERHGRGEVVDHLRQHPRPVDRVHRTARPHALREKGRSREHGLELGLTVVEVAVEGARAWTLSRAAWSSAASAPRTPRHAGRRMNTSTTRSPRNASMAADPVSPEVAPTMAMRFPDARARPGTAAR